jgi:uncharacterized DUF497 family protein
MTIEFEWDAVKAKSNLGKHRISFEEATSAFYDTLSVTIADPDHSVKREPIFDHWHDDDQASRGGGSHRPWWTNSDN